MWGPKISLLRLDDEEWSLIWVEVYSLWAENKCDKEGSKSEWLDSVFREGWEEHRFIAEFELWEFFFSADVIVHSNADFNRSLNMDLFDSDLDEIICIRLSHCNTGLKFR